MFFLEGINSVGKSTFLRLVKKYIPSIDIGLEPLENWKKKRHGQSLLENFYNNSKRWSFTIDTFTLMCRVREHIMNQKKTNKNRLLERSIYSGYYGYALTDYKLGNMIGMEWKLHNEWFKYLTEICNPPIGFIYLKCDPNIAYQRSKIRNRQEEMNVKLTFLQELSRRHDDFLIFKTNVISKIKNTPVLVLNCDDEFERCKTNLSEHLERIKQFINDTQVGTIHK